MFSGIGRTLQKKYDAVISIYFSCLTMIILYNILQIILFPLLFIPLAIFVLLTPRYRSRALARLGIGLKSEAADNRRKTIWIHALSVGEVTSALPLISGLRKHMPDIRLVFSATSKAGAATAEKLLHDKVDQIIPFPYDISPVIKRFLRVIRPDLFILVETDFWPNIISILRQQKIPTLLVNGRISEESFQSYQRYSFFFKPLFSSFQTLSMQTKKDKANLIKLGIDNKQIQTLGNLKYDTALYSDSKRYQPLSFSLPSFKHLLVAGSTHEGEERILLKSFRELKKEYPDLYLIIAPRIISRGENIQNLAAEINLAANRRSQINAGGKDLFILDSIGELNSVYSHADVAFVGGSLVNKRGHNPIEPAIYSIPVLYGEHMEDFSEISDALLLAGGSFMVKNQNELTTTLQKILRDAQLREKLGSASRACILSQQGVIDRHIRLLKEML